MISCIVKPLRQNHAGNIHPAPKVSNMEYEDFISHPFTPSILSGESVNGSMSYTHALCSSYHFLLSFSFCYIWIRILLNLVNFQTIFDEVCRTACIVRFSTVGKSRINCILSPLISNNWALCVNSTCRYGNGLCNFVISNYIFTKGFLESPPGTQKVTNWIIRRQ